MKRCSKGTKKGGPPPRASHPSSPPRSVKKTSRHPTPAPSRFENDSLVDLLTTVPKNSAASQRPKMNAVPAKEKTLSHRMRKTKEKEKKAFGDGPTPHSTTKSVEDMPLSDLLTIKSTLPAMHSSTAKRNPTADASPAAPMCRDVVFTVMAFLWCVVTPKTPPPHRIPQPVSTNPQGEKVPTPSSLPNVAPEKGMEVPMMLASRAPSSDRPSIPIVSSPSSSSRCPWWSPMDVASVLSMSTTYPSGHATPVKGASKDVQQTPKKRRTPLPHQDKEKARVHAQSGATCSSEERCPNAFLSDCLQAEKWTDMQQALAMHVDTPILMEMRLALALLSSNVGSQYTQMKSFPTTGTAASSSSSLSSFRLSWRGEGKDSKNDAPCEQEELEKRHHQQAASSLWFPLREVLGALVPSSNAGLVWWYEVFCGALRAVDALLCLELQVRESTRLTLLKWIQQHPPPQEDSLPFPTPTTKAKEALGKKKVTPAPTPGKPTSTTRLGGGGEITDEDVWHMGPASGWEHCLRQCCPSPPDAAFSEGTTDPPLRESTQSGRPFPFPRHGDAKDEDGPGGTIATGHASSSLPVTTSRTAISRGSTKPNLSQTQKKRPRQPSSIFSSKKRKRQGSDSDVDTSSLSLDSSSSSNSEEEEESTSESEEEEKAGKRKKKAPTGGRRSAPPVKNRKSKAQAD